MSDHGFDYELEARIEHKIRSTIEDFFCDDNGVLYYETIGALVGTIAQLVANASQNHGQSLREEVGGISRLLKRRVKQVATQRILMKDLETNSTSIN